MSSIKPNHQPNRAHSSTGISHEQDNDRKTKNIDEMDSKLDAASRQPLDLKAARALGTFDTEEFGAIIQGGKAELERHRFFLKLVDEEMFRKEKRIHRSREEGFLASLKMNKRLAELSIEHKDKIKEVDLLRFASYADEPSPLYLQFGMFMVAMRTQTDPEQYKEWYDQIIKFRILGCYAQTELGHGSGLANLETTATLDKETDEWIINSPTLSSAKFWPGGLGKFSNHAIVYAQLFIDGKCYGPHGFLTQIREFEDHRERKGVTLGDIGPKVGYVGMDNGYAKFESVRIPRRNMLMRFAAVTRDGKYSKPPHSKLGYAIMTESRVGIVDSSWRALAKSLVVAIRYCIVRRQGPQRGLEPQVIDYALVQHRLFPLLAKTMAINASYIWLNELYNEMMTSLDFSLLPEVHAMSSALKAYSTTAAANGIEEARRCLGGQGYLLVSGIPGFFNSFIGALAFEGENGLLTQQTARYLLKQASGSGLPGRSTRFLSNTDYCLSAFVGLPPLTELKNILGHRVLHQLNYLKSQTSSWDSLNVECFRVSKAQAEFTCLCVMMERAETLKAQNISQPSLEVYNLLALIYGLSCIEESPGDFLEAQSITPDQIQLIRNALKQSFVLLRPQVALLVDSFHLPDHYLGSALGASDGRAYEKIVQSVRENPLNTPVHGEAVLGYTKYIRPLVHGHILTPENGPRSKI